MKDDFIELLHDLEGKKLQMVEHIDGKRKRTTVVVKGVTGNKNLVLLVKRGSQERGLVVPIGAYSLYSKSPANFIIDKPVVRSFREVADE